MFLVVLCTNVCTTFFTEEGSTEFPPQATINKNIMSTIKLWYQHVGGWMGNGWTQFIVFFWLIKRSCSVVNDVINISNQLNRNHFGYYSLISPAIYSRELLHTKKRQDDTLEQLYIVLGESCINCELQLAGPEYESQHCISSISPAIAEELFRCELWDKESHSQALSPDMTILKKASVMVDNSLSPAHTLLQIHCVDHKGLVYDILRTLKDCNIQVLIIFPCLSNRFQVLSSSFTS